MYNTIKATVLALAVLAVFSSFGTHAYAQNVTGTRDHDRDRGNLLGLGLGVRAHIGLGSLPFAREHEHIGLGGGNTVVVPSAPTEHNFVGAHNFVGGTHDRDFGRFHDFAFAHREHFIFLRNQYVLLPEQVGCPAGSNLDVNTGECVIYQQTLIQQAAPTILSESVQAPAIVQQQQQTVTTQTQTVAPTVTCPAGSTLQADNTCTVTTSQTQTVQPIVTCPVGTSLQNGACIIQQQQITVDPLPCPSCPEGSTLANGQCVVSALPSQVIVGQTPGEIVILGHHFHHGGDLPFQPR